MSTITIPANKLLALEPFIAKDDVRYYLNGVNVEVREKDTLLVATDGHRLTIIRCHKEECDDAPNGTNFILPWDTMTAAFVKATAKCRMGDFIVNYPDDASACEEVALVSAAGRQIVKLIDGKFPDWQRVVPSKPAPLTNISFDGRYLADYVKALKALGRPRWYSTSLAFHGDGNSVLVSIGDPDFISVLMPMTADIAVLPEWLNPTEPASDESQQLQEAA
jgi:DNA polymerase-3 subunit beta